MALAASALQVVTLGVSDLRESLRLFHDLMGLQIDREAALPEELLRFWGVAAGVSARAVELSCGGYPVGRLRLVAFDPPARQRARDDHGPGCPDTPFDVGPKAIDFYVRPPITDAVKDIEGAGYRFRSAPIRYEIGPYESEELLFSGPDNTPILIMIGHRHPESSQRRLPPGVRYSEVPTVSIRCADIAATRRFYGEALGLHCGTDAEVTDEFRDLACTLTGVPKGSRLHFLTYQKQGEPSGKTLLIHLFERTGRRLTDRMRPGNLGVTLYTYEADDLVGLRARLMAAGGAIVAEPAHCAGRQRMLVKGPNEELFEFLEQAG